MSCAARLILVACPAILRVASTLPSANLANAAIDGKATQFGTRSSSRVVS